jgi:hypothetical protein
MSDALHDDLPRYPGGAGYREDDASKDGARKVNRDGSRVTQCEYALTAIDRAGPDGIDAYRVYGLPDAPFRDLSTCRARLSDLKRQGRIVKKGERTPGEAGVSVNLWIAARFAPKPLDGQGDLFADGGRHVAG